MMLVLGTIAAYQMKGKADTTISVAQLLDYCATQANKNYFTMPGEWYSASTEIYLTYLT